MNSQRIFGLFLLAVGVTLFIIGTNASNSFSDQVSNAFTGHFTDKTTWYILGGVILSLAGLSMSVFSGNRKSA